MRTATAEFMNTSAVQHPARVSALSIVIPVHNEADCIAGLIEEIAATQHAPTDYEIIVVDDASTDATAQRLTELKARRIAPLRVLRHDRRAGQSAATRTGVLAARYAWIATLDGDGQNDPADIATLVNALSQSQDTRVQMVCGQRRRRQDSWLKGMSSRIANTIRSRLLDDGIRDTGCALKLFRRDAFLRLPWFDHMHRFLPALMQRDGIGVITVNVNHRPRMGGQTKYGVHNRLWVGIVDLIGVMWLQRRNKIVLSDEQE